MTVRILICERCDARETLGGNPQARLNYLIGIGWDYRERGDNFCPACCRLREAERRRDGK
jgi:hypothetical protein